MQNGVLVLKGKHLFVLLLNMHINAMQYTGLCLNEYKILFLCLKIPPSIVYFYIKHTGKMVKFTRDAYVKRHTNLYFTVAHQNMAVFQINPKTHHRTEFSVLSVAYGKFYFNWFDKNAFCEFEIKL